MGNVEPRVGRQQRGLRGVPPVGRAGCGRRADLRQAHPV